MRQLALCLAVCVACASASAMTITDLNIGKHASGPNLTQKDLSGKVVFVVYWGTH
ncbi:MAG TPA: hypothetical protein VKX17_12830 [Planctomycetota bacterium]|nr:hypothetical protein [Planctomycetota bacterium]